MWHGRVAAVRSVLGDLIPLRLEDGRHFVRHFVASGRIRGHLVGIHLQINKRIILLEFHLEWEEVVEGEALASEAEDGRLAIVEVGNVPEEHAVGCVLLRVHILLQELYIGEAVAHVEANGHVVERFEFEILLILVVLDLHGDYVLALLL